MKIREYIPKSLQKPNMEGGGLSTQSMGFSVLQQLVLTIEARLVEFLEELKT